MKDDSVTKRVSTKPNITRYTEEELPLVDYSRSAGDRGEQFFKKEAYQFDYPATVEETSLIIVRKKLFYY